MYACMHVCMYIRIIQPKVDLVLHPGEIQPSEEEGALVVCVHACMCVCIYMCKVKFSHPKRMGH